MSDLLIRDVTPEVMERLKTQAAAKGHSMQVEAKSILENGVHLSNREWLAMVQRSSAQIAERRGPINGSTADLIREAREERDRAIDSAVRGSNNEGGSDE